MSETLHAIHAQRSWGGNKHFLALDGLRAIAALAVILYHRRWWVDASDFFRHAYLAVDFFFVLSGLVVAGAYETRLRTGEMSWFQFARLRVIRLYPLLLVGALLGISFLCMRAVLTHDAAKAIANLAAFPFAAIAVPAPSCLLDRPFAINDPSWTLFFEVCANLLFAVGAPRLSNRVLAILIAASAVALLSVAIAFDGLNAGWAWGAFHVGATRVCFSFLLGVALSRMLAARRLPQVSVPFCVLSALLVTALCPRVFASSLNIVYDLGMTMFVFPLLIVLGCNWRGGFQLGSLLQTGGAMSYPAYIIHVPLLAWSEALIWRLHLPNTVMLLVGTLVVWIAAWMLWRYYDVPIRRWLTDRSASELGRGFAP